MYVQEFVDELHYAGVIADFEKSVDERQLIYVLDGRRGESFADIDNQVRVDVKMLAKAIAESLKSRMLKNHDIVIIHCRIFFTKNVCSAKV